MWKYFYLIHIQFLGYRFHGWAKQPKVKTLHQMVDKTFDFILPGKEYKTLGSSRTDAMVSANDMAFELFVTEPFDCDRLLFDLNDNFPPDMHAISVEEVGADFNIIQASKVKEYVYLFAFGIKPHPFSCPNLYTFPEKLDIELMKEGAKILEGEHNFRRYCTKPKENGQFIRSIEKSSIEVNDVITASFFPKETWAYHVHSKGFMRNQVRLMMGQLYELGKGSITLDDLKESLKGVGSHFDYIAPASGLLLNKTHFKKSP